MGRGRPVVAMVLCIAHGPGAGEAGDALVEAVAGSVDGVRLAADWLARPVREAVRGASRRLAEPGCRAVLDDFSDREGRPLRRRLEEVGVDAAAYARMVLFYDGARRPPCQRRRALLAYTAPGFRFVRVCPRLARLARSDPREAEIVVIHEILHTLGLAENPPTHAEITTRVWKRCGPVPAPTSSGSR